MSGNPSNSYGYYYPPPPPPPPSSSSSTATISTNPYQEQSQQWNNWAVGQQQQYSSHNYQNKNVQNYYGNGNLNGASNVLHQNSQSIVRPQHQFLSPQNVNNIRPYRQKRYNRNNDNSNGYLNIRHRNNVYNKRPRLDQHQQQHVGHHHQQSQHHQQHQDMMMMGAGGDVTKTTKSSRKKKKPLSQNVPSVRCWTPEDAIKALAVEKEYNKWSNNHSLIIRFPDLPLNKEIVSKFHSAIQNVHFQQASTARYCYVNLDESVDADSVINALNKEKFGNGYLTAEYKRDREDDQNIGPDDIDPLTLYVGNLAQEIIKEDLVTIYPKTRRIDIGFAKKMKFTRYAFVSFRNVEDSIEAFKKTHSTELYSKSLIVRFRRLHGTVGMPGETKTQNSTKKPTETDDVVSGDTFIKTSTSTVNNSDGNNVTETIVDNNSTQIPVQIAEEIVTMEPDVRIKQEPSYSGYYEVGDVASNVIEDDVKPPPALLNTLVKSEYKSPFMVGNVDEVFARHKPFVQVEVKTEKKFDGDKDETNNVNEEGRRNNRNILNAPESSGKAPEPKQSTAVNENVPTVSHNKDSNVKVKSEPNDDFDIDSIEYYEHNNSDDDFDSEEEETMTPNFLQIYHTMVNHENKMSELKKLTTK